MKLRSSFKKALELSRRTGLAERACFARQPKKQQIARPNSARGMADALVYRQFRRFLPLLLCIAAAGARVCAQTPSQEAVSVDLLITGATIVTMDADRRVVEGGFLAVRGDSVVAIGEQAAIAFPKGVNAARTIDARGKIVLPGLINGHTHIPMVLMRGLKDDVTLDDWLRKYIFPAEARNVTEETKAAGLRGFLGETWLDFPAPDSKNAAEMAAYTEQFLKKWQGDPLIHAAVAPHSIYTCSEKTLRDSATMARKYHAPILIHVSEMRKEFTDSIKTNGATPVQYLDRIGLLGPDVLAAHCIWLEGSDMRILAERQAGCVHNPSSNMMLASGVAAVVEQRAAGMRVGLGTDGPAGSNNDLNMMEEMDLAAKLQKTYRVDPRALGAKGALEMATIEGARALHMEKEIGSLEAGKKADLIVLNLNVPNA